MFGHTSNISPISPILLSIIEVSKQKGYQMKKLLTSTILATILLATTQGVYAQKISTKSLTEYNKAQVKDSIVKVFTVTNEADFDSPWSSSISGGTGSGCIIEGDKILTNAHVVSDATYIEVLKNGEIKRYEAEVLSIDHEADLALITVKDKQFFKNTKSLEIGEVPSLQEKIRVYGFPMGGETLSVTEGVVSRVENQYYAHSQKSLLAIQIDASINPGNSGGPAILNGKIVGLVMQEIMYGENLGYMIPTSIIKHYLQDMKDGKYDGFPYLGMMVQGLESSVMKEKYGLKGKNYGILINKTIPNSPASRVLKTGDILTAIDGYRVFSNLKVEFRKKEFTNFRYALDKHQLGDSINFTILRDNQEKNVSVVLDKKTNELTLVKRQNPETKPSYFIYGGLVFVPGIKEHMYSSYFKYYSTYPDNNREELVLLKRVLPSSLTKGLDKYSLDVIDSVNGKKVKNFKEFVSLLENSQEQFIVFEDEDHVQMILNRKDVLEKQKTVLKKYGIKSYKSDDL